MNHEEQEAELQSIASKKCCDTLTNIADAADSTDCGYDDYFATVDNINLGLKGTKQGLWAVSYLETGADEPTLIFLFIGKTYEEVKAKIEALPDKMNAAQRAAFITKIEGLVECRFVEFDSPDTNFCRIVVDDDAPGWQGKVIDGVRLTVCHDPKHYRKKPKKPKA